MGGDGYYLKVGISSLVLGIDFGNCKPFTQIIPSNLLLKKNFLNYFVFVFLLVTCRAFLKVIL